MWIFNDNKPVGHSLELTYPTTKQSQYSELQQPDIVSGGGGQSWKPLFRGGLLSFRIWQFNDKRYVCMHICT